MATLLTSTLLLLNLDINKTLIAEDMATNKSMEYILSNALAEKCVHVWEENTPAMTYRDYVDTYLAPGDKPAQREIVKNFISYIGEAEYPNKRDLLDIYHRAHEKMQGKYLIPSFVKMVRHLQQRDVQFRLILRTFGNDIRVGKITEELDQILDASRVEYWGEFKGDTLYIKHGPTLEKVEDIYRFFKESSGHIAIRDDWKKWHDDDERGRAGKPFIFDSSDEGVISLFFDDNINPDTGSEFNIVSPMLTDGSVVPLNGLMNHTVFIADVIEAILDDDYFIKKVSCHINAFEVSSHR